MLASFYSSPNGNQPIKALGKISCINSVGNDGSDGSEISPYLEIFGHGLKWLLNHFLEPFFSVLSNCLHHMFILTLAYVLEWLLWFCCGFWKELLSLSRKVIRQYQEVTQRQCYICVHCGSEITLKFLAPSGQNHKMCNKILLWIYVCLDS